VVVSERDILGTQVHQKLDPAWLIQPARPKHHCLLDSHSVLRSCSHPAWSPLVQLIRRNEELALLYEKIRIQESSLEKGAQHYKMRVKEVDDLRQQIIDVQKELTGIGGSVAAMNTLRNEVYQLQRELLLERTKVRT
jgi:hypothetical protein